MPKQWRESYVKALLCVAAAGTALAIYLPVAGAGDQPTASSVNDNNANANQTEQPLQLPDGIQAKDVSADSGVKSTLAGLTNRALTKDSYDSMTSSFLAELDKPDKERAKEFKGVDQSHLNSVIDQIQAGWNSKYGQKFDISDKNAVFNDQFQIVQGEVTDEVAAGRNWPVDCCAPMPANATANQNQINAQQSKTPDLAKGDDVAIIQFPVGDGFNHLRVSTVYHTLSGWYISVPASRTGEQIYNSLVSHLEFIAGHQANWPADINDGYRMAARHVIGALYGVPSPGEANSQASAQ